MKKILLTIACVAAMGVSTQCGLAASDKPEMIKVGGYEVYVFQDVANEGKSDILIDAPADVLARYAPDGTFPMATNAVLVRNGDRVWLIDTGYGRTVFDRMAALGIRPADVDEVLLTHTHGDHVGGMLRDGAKAFPNAVVSLSEREFDYGEGNDASARIFAAYGDAVRKFSPAALDGQVQDGITPVAAYGHTPGHTIFMICDGDSKLLVWGDVAHAMAVQMPRPEISVRYDADPDAARESRLKVLKYVADNDLPVVGMHIPVTTPGRLAVRGNGYEFNTKSEK